ncbi:MAG: VOC family protein [Lacibacter sp.]
MKVNLDTIILYVQDVELLKTFYVEIFELEVIEETPLQWVLLQAGQAKIGLHRIGEQYRNEAEGTFKFDSNCKIVFETDEDIHAVLNRLLSRNVAMREVKTFNNYDYWLCDGEDPEGNVFQLKQKKQE